MEMNAEQVLFSFAVCVQAFVAYLSVCVCLWLMVYERYVPDKEYLGFQLVSLATDDTLFLCWDPPLRLLCDRICSSLDRIG